MAKKLNIIKCIFILFCIFSAVKSQQDEYIDEDIYDVKKASKDCDFNNIFRGLSVKKNFERNRNKGGVERIKEENKKNRMGKLLNNFNQIIIY